MAPPPRRLVWMRLTSVLGCANLRHQQLCTEVYTAIVDFASELRDICIIVSVSYIIGDQRVYISVNYKFHLKGSTNRLRYILLMLIDT